jgi:outer membrane protein assembly factor BamD (BamD/ComL family)
MNHTDHRQHESSRASFSGPALLTLLALLTLGALASCQTTYPDIPDGFSAAEYFQQGQEAAAAERWRLALYYYESFVEQFPGDTQNVVAAEYEIAFLNYKMGNTDEAIQLFEALIDRYETEEGANLPEWPEVLSQRLLSELRGEEAP